VRDDLERLLNDPNHFPRLTISKRYLGYANAVYDLEENVALSWDQVRADPEVMPFNFLDQEFPVDMLQHAKAACPEPIVDVLQFNGGDNTFVPTPLFDGPLRDQGFTVTSILWLYALLGRLFHYVGKQGGDNCEVLLFLIGAPGSFKSSIADIIQCYFQPNQVGVIGTRVEPQFPLDGVVGKLIAIMTECGGCTLDRDLLKLIASGDPVRITGKHKDGH